MADKLEPALDSDELPPEAADPLDRSPAPAKRKSGLWLYAVVLAVVGFFAWHSYATKAEKATDGTPTVTSTDQPFVPTAKRPKSAASTPAPESFEPANTTASTASAGKGEGAEKKLTDEEKKALALEEKRLRAPLLIAVGGTQSAIASSAPATDRQPAMLVPGVPEPKPETAAPANPDVAFYEKGSQSKPTVVRATPPRDRHYIINEGTMIDATLETAANSDLPGNLRAVVDEDVFGEDAFPPELPLLPKFTRLLGKYNSDVRNGQTRMLTVWTRAIRPDGSSIDLGSYGTDSLGRSGMTGEVDNHYIRRFGGALVMSLIGGTVGLAGAQQGEDTALTLYRLQIVAAGQKQGSDMLKDDIKIPPTINVDQGTRIKVYVAKDLDFSLVRKGAE